MTFDSISDKGYLSDSPQIPLSILHQFQENLYWLSLHDTLATPIAWIFQTALLLCSNSSSCCQLAIATFNVVTKSLRSIAITATSSLLRTCPPLCDVSILSASQSSCLCLSLNTVTTGSRSST